MAVHGIGGYSQEYTYQYKNDTNQNTDTTQNGRAKADITDCTLELKKNNKYNLVAATSEAEDIDVSKALLDMKKDNVLDRYKFFVNHARLGTDSDGTVRLKRD
ncbi:MAG: hypothetical protein Q4F11_01505 [Eubacteriales bacterium]|nr:hypothetical protein [Eubacteriales bacterium]